MESTFSLSEDKCAQTNLWISIIFISVRMAALSQRPSLVLVCGTLCRLNAH